MTDYQTFTTKDMPIKQRRKLNVGNIWNNAVECPYCHETIRSKNRHDYAQCSCKKTFIDGGSHYVRTTPDAISKIELYDLIDKNE